MGSEGEESERVSCDDEASRWDAASVSKESIFLKALLYQLYSTFYSTVHSLIQSRLIGDMFD